MILRHHICRSRSRTTKPRPAHIHHEQTEPKGEKKSKAKRVIKQDISARGQRRPPSLALVPHARRLVQRLVAEPAQAQALLVRAPLERVLDPVREVLSAHEAAHDACEPPLLLHVHERFDGNARGQRRERREDLRFGRRGERVRVGVEDNGVVRCGGIDEIWELVDIRNLGEVDA